MKLFGRTIVCILVAIMLATVLASCAPEGYADYSETVEATMISEENIPSEAIVVQEVDENLPVQEFEVQNNITTSIDAQTLIEEQEEYILDLVNYLYEDDYLGVNIQNVNAQVILSEIEEAEARIDIYNPIFEELQEQEEIAAQAARRQAQETEYESATYIWYFFKDQGFSDAATAAILGNIMAEVGGQTLYIQYWLSSSSYYGMCQWSLKYYGGVVGASLADQCQYLLDTMPNEFNYYGYIGGYSYEEFKNATNEQSAALAFAKTYERCGSGSYSVRQRNATTALNYFTN